MSRKHVEYTKCIYCKSVVEVDIDFAIRNGRIFCNTCCKSFDIKVGEREVEKPTEKKKTTNEDVDDEGYW